MEQTPITRALDKIQSYPFVSFTLGPSATDFNLEDPETYIVRFGSLIAPDVEAILEASQPSSFGKGRPPSSVLYATLRSTFACPTPR